MREITWAPRRGLIGSVALAALLVLSVVIGALAAVPATHAAPKATTANAVPDVTKGPLVQLPSSSSKLSTSGPTSFGQFSVVPAPGKYSANAPLSVVVTLKPTADLKSFVDELSNPTSSQYRHFLTAPQLGQQFGASAGTYSSVVSYFQSFGLTVAPSSTLLSMTVSGTVTQAAAAFHTKMASFEQVYQSNGMWQPSFGPSSGIAGTTSTGPVFYGNTAPVQLPSKLAGLVGGIAGLDGMRATPNILMPLGMHPNWSNNSTPPPPAFACATFFFPSGCDAQINAGQNINKGNYLWTNCTAVGFGGSCTNYQFLFPSTLHVLTGAQNLWNGLNTISSEPDLGQGITIAVIEVGCAIPSDLMAWSNATFGDPNQLMDRLTQIALNQPSATSLSLFGEPNNNLNACILNGEFAGWTGETSLDIEYAAAMAPKAHIDVIGLGSPFFSAFDDAFAQVAQFLSTGAACALAGGEAVVVAGSAGNACSVTITSNSYGSGEPYEYFFGSPMYITSADTLLEALNAIGVTNFFASGDGGGTDPTGVAAFANADSPGATAVGGGQVTATGDGAEFPVTSNSFTYCIGFLFNSTTCFGTSATAYWVPASGVSSFTYWAYGFGSRGTFQGEVGGGFGQSYVEPQPWWQNALDTYSSGSNVMPQVSGSAAFNMTFYAFGSWSFFFGGTSFATPIQAGEWALIEEQANVAFGHPMMGDVNPLLFAAHNAFQAGAGGVSTDPFIPMMNIGTTFDSAPVNSFTWYYYNLSIMEPTAGTQPFWFPTLFNPAGSGWNYLQGVGMPDATILENALFGQTGIAGHSLADPAFQVLQVTGGGLASFTTLASGSTYTLEVVDATGNPGVYDVTAYSGGSDAGALGGGTTTSFQTGSNGQFKYTPLFGSPPGGNGATTYGYFLATSVVGGGNAEWSFTDFAVAAPPAAGDLTLCVVDPYGNCTQGNGETTMFTTVMAGFFSLYGQSQVYLNGLPVSGAEVTQVSMQSQYGVEDPTLPPALYAPGATIGHTLSDARGTALFWTDVDPLAEVNGALFTQVYRLTAAYDGLTSNTVTVFVEPQSGSFYTGNLAMDQNGEVTGTVQFADMKYVNWINVSVGSAPGQYVNTSYPPVYYDSAGHIWESGVDNGAIPVDLSTTGLKGPVVVSVLAEGDNDLSVLEIFSFFTFKISSVQNPIYWQDPTVFLPTHLSSDASGTVTGIVHLTYSGVSAAKYPGVSATLSLVSGGTTTVLATSVSGTYALDTSKLPDGAYVVVYSENAAGAIGQTRTVTFYADNHVAALTADVASLTTQLSQDQATISSLQATVAGLESGWAATNASLALLSGQLAALQATLATDQATIASLQSQLAALQSTNSINQAEIAQLQSELSTAQTNAASEAVQISALETQVAQLQQELAQKHPAAAAPWYSAFGSAGVIASIIVAGLAALGAGFALGRGGNRRDPASDSRTAGAAEREERRTMVRSAMNEPETVPSLHVSTRPPRPDPVAPVGPSATSSSGPPFGARLSAPSEEWLGRLN